MIIPLKSSLRKSAYASFLGLLVASVSGFTLLFAACGGSETTSKERIVFVSNRDGNPEVYVMNSDGSSQTRLTNNSTEEIDPLWSPDCNMILFTSLEEVGIDDQTSLALYTMKSDGSDLKRLAVSARGYTFSPDGTMVAFGSQRDEQGHDIFVVDVKGSNLTVLTDTATDDSYPSWSPDGSKLTFATRKPAVDEMLPDPRLSYLGSDIHVIRSDGSNLVRLTDTPSYVYNTTPVWSPDGSRIAFLADRDEPFLRQLYVMNADGSNQTRLTNPSSGVENFRWSPDSQKLLFSNAEIRLYVINADGSHPNLLVSGDSPVVGATWSTDGSEIVFSHDKDFDRLMFSLGPDGNEIYVVDENGLNQNSLTGSAGSNYLPAWCGTSP